MFTRSCTSPALRQAEEERLIERAVAAFHTKARVATQALGLSSYSLREIAVGSVQGGGIVPMQAPMMRAAKTMAEDTADLPVQGGRVPLQLSVSGSVQMKR